MGRMRRTTSAPVAAALLIVTCAVRSAAAGSDALRAAASPAPAAPQADWLRIEVGACVLEAPAESAGRLRELAERARVILPRIEAELGIRPAAPYRIILIPPGRAPLPVPPGGPDPQLLDSQAPSWAAGFVIPERRLGAIRVAAADSYPYSDLASVLAHEATHMLLYDADGPGLPRWFGEGVATGIERSWGMRDVLVYSSSLLTARLPALADLGAAFDASDDRARAAYAAAFDFMLWTVKTFGNGVVRDIVRQAAVRPFPEAWLAATGTSLERSETQWRRGSLLLYRWVPALTGTTALWMGITLLALVAGARRRARSRRILERWEIERDMGEE